MDFWIIRSIDHCIIHNIIEPHMLNLNNELIWIWIYLNYEYEVDLKWIKKYYLKAFRWFSFFSFHLQLKEETFSREMMKIIVILSVFFHTTVNTLKMFLFLHFTKCSFYLN